MLQYPAQFQKYSLVAVVEKMILNFFLVLDQLDIGVQPQRRSKGLILRDPHKKSAIKSLFNDFKFQMEEYGVYTAAIAIVSLNVEFEVKKRQAETISLKTMYRAAISLCDQIRHLLVKKLRDLVDDEETNDEQVNTEAIIMNFSTPKVQRFLHYLKQTFGGKPKADICCLVFVERRYTAKCIYGLVKHFIESTPELRDVLVPQFMVGRNSISQDFESVLDHKFQKSVSL